MNELHDCINEPPDNDRCVLFVHEGSDPIVGRYVDGTWRIIACIGMRTIIAMPGDKWAEIYEIPGEVVTFSSEKQNEIMEVRG